MSDSYYFLSCPGIGAAGGRSLYSEVPCLGGWGKGACTVRSNASWVMVTWDPCEQTDRQKRKHYLPATSLTGGNDTVMVAFLLNVVYGSF